ncbi:MULTISPECIES: ferrochelatase [unclassified Brevundimonas]|uniref:ferrochelatase n=1 Tax=unclassified Brevundimonas TaxID=2622653 RepID=UPI002899C237|nr:ferrochelatase [Brevundimonas sp.]
MSVTPLKSGPGRRIAVVLANLGGPDGPDSVKPFLFNLFNDPAIIGLPGIFRTPLAKLISSRREKPAQENYALMGGGSPLLPETRKQAEALEARLNATLPDDETRVFIAMRYWHPFTDETARAVEAFRPDEVVFLPLYPQYSTTTTASSLKLWRNTYKGSGRQHTVCCYPQSQGFVEAQARMIRETMARAEGKPVRVLFSAHGIPSKLVEKGDPYQAQVEATVAAVVAKLGLTDWAICYQSKVGPLEWLGPATPDAIKQAAADRVGALVVPIAFVSEHIETLVELDIEYGELAHEVGCAPYLRAPAVGADADFIAALAQETLTILGGQTSRCGNGSCACDDRFANPVRPTTATEVA